VIEFKIKVNSFDFYFENLLIYTSKQFIKNNKGRLNNMKLSVLNLAPLRSGENFKDAIDAMVRLAQKTEQLGYERYWVAEHHNTKSVASSATQLLIQHTLANTKNIRVGSGGVMLPNHSPYIVAEQYGTLETLYPFPRKVQHSLCCPKSCCLGSFDISSSCQSLIFSSIDKSRLF